MNYLYFLINLCTIIVPFIFSYHPKINFHKHFKAFFIANFLIASIFISWDYIFTDLGIWGFNPKYISGFHLLNLPIEEILFFICIPFSCVFTYHAINKFKNFKRNEHFEKIFSLVLSLVLIVLSCCFLDKKYTFYCFLSSGILIFSFVFLFKINWFTKILYVYPILIIPFLIVNGILTGTGIEQEVVWYNNKEIIGFRILTIPIEDFVYGFELIIANLFFYERFRQTK
ncbi:MAG: lycopene cyclase domain-containing protein [Bacteroidota bacterium]